MTAISQMMVTYLPLMDDLLTFNRWCHSFGRAQMSAQIIELKARSSDELLFPFHTAGPSFNQYHVANKTTVRIYDLRLKTCFTRGINQSCLIPPTLHFMFIHSVLGNSDKPIKPNQSLARSRRHLIIPSSKCIGKSQVQLFILVF